MGLRAFQEDFERLAAGVEVPAMREPSPSVAQASDEIGRSILAGLENFNLSMNLWRDNTERTITVVRTLLDSAAEDEEFTQIVAFAVSAGLPRIVAGVDQAIAMLEKAQANQQAKELELRRVVARDRNLKRVVHDIVRRQKIIFAKHLKTAGELRDKALILAWDIDPDTREITGAISSDDDIDAFFAELR